MAYCASQPNALGSKTRWHESVAHAERVHSDRVGPFIADHERVANERQRATVKSIPNSELWRTVLGGPVHGALNLDGASPLRMPSGFSVTGSGEEWLVMHGSRLNYIMAQRNRPEPPLWRTVRGGPIHTAP